MTEDKIRISVYLPESLCRKLYRLSCDTDRDRSWLVNRALEIAWERLQEFVVPTEERRL